MEQHNKFQCHCSIEPPCQPAGDGGALEFFNKYHYALIWNMFDPEWDHKTKLEEIFKKLSLIYKFTSEDKDIIIVHNEEKIYIPGYYVLIPPGAIFVYDRTKVDVIF